MELVFSFITVIKENPCKYVKKPTCVGIPGTDIPLSTLKLIIAAAEPELAYAIKGYLLTGARRDELMDITQSDIDYAGRLLHIPGTKTKTSDRYIPLFSMLKNLLDGNTKEHPFRIAKINYKILKLRQSCGLTEEQ